MGNGPHGPSVPNRVMVAISIDRDHTTVVWPMMLRLLCVVPLVPIRHGPAGPAVRCATILVNRPFWRNDNVVKRVPANTTSKRKRVWRRDVLIGLSGVVGERVPEHVVMMVLAFDHVLVSDQPSSVPL